MSQGGMQRLYQIVRIVGLAVLISTVVSGAGCGFVSQSTNHNQGDPLNLGGSPGPDGTLLNPQTIQVRVGSQPSDRIVSLSLTLSSLQAVNSGSQRIDLLTAPITVEFTHSATVTEPISILDIYQDTYSSLVFPAMTGQVVFYDKDGQLVSQDLIVPGQTIASSFVVNETTGPLVLNVSLDLAQSFTINDPTGNTRFGGNVSPDASGSSVTVNSLVVTTETAVPNNPVGQPESGSIAFLVGSASAVNETSKTITIQPASGDSVKVFYSTSGGTDFVNCTPAMLAGMLIEIEGATQSNGTVLATEVELISNATSGSELYGLLSGYAPEGIYYNLIVEGGEGVNVTNSLVGKNVTVNWDGASYSVNNANLDLSGTPELVFDEEHAFPGQFVELEWDALIVPDPESANAGAMQPGMFELEQQTISGTVSGYTYDSGTQKGTFTLNVASNASIRTMNPGLVSIIVRRVPQTYLQNNPTFGDGASVKVRGLVFADPSYSNANYHPSPSTPMAFIIVAGRISK